MGDYISAGVGGLSVVLSWLWSVARNPPISPLGPEVFIGPKPEEKDDSSLDPNEKKESNPPEDNKPQNDGPSSNVTEEKKDPPQKKDDSPKPLVIVPTKEQTGKPVPSPPGRLGSPVTPALPPAQAAPRRKPTDFREEPSEQKEQVPPSQTGVIGGGASSK